MKRSIFVVEGQTEQIFVEKFLQELGSYQHVTITLTKLHGGAIYELRNATATSNDTTHLIQILNAEGDDSVLSVIAEYLDAFKGKGFTGVYGLRDRYTGSNAKEPLDQKDIDDFVAKYCSDPTIDTRITLAIQEVEAWFLAAPAFFAHFHADLTTDAVAKILNFDLDVVAVESLDHPAALIKQVLSTKGLKYRKKAADSYKIAYNLDYTFLYVEKSNSIPSLQRFISTLNCALD